MASWQARCVNVAVTLIVRRRNWGGELALTRRARQVFGAPRVYRWLRTHGVELHPVREAHVAGEWIVPRTLEPERGTILYIHGGGYVACSAATHRPITAALARLSRRRVFAIDYRLSPEHRFPAALDDCVQAYRWLLDRDVDPESLVLAGDSAGGGLVLATLHRVRDAGWPLPACAICFSPWTDLEGTGESVQSNDGRCAMFHPENIADFAAVYLGGASTRDPSASPWLADYRGLPPILLQVGADELLLEDARRVHERIQHIGGGSQLQVFDGVCHCWQMFDGLVPEARRALGDAVAFATSRVKLRGSALKSRRLPQTGSAT